MAKKKTKREKPKADPKPSHRCTACKDTGVAWRNGVSVSCPACNERRRVKRQPCETCGGASVVDRKGTSVRCPDCWNRRARRVA